MQKKSKHNGVKTTELMNFLAKEISYENDKERDKQMEYKEELEKRQPFSDIKHKIDCMSRQLNEVRDAMRKLADHRHDGQGNVTIPMKKSISGRYF